VHSPATYRTAISLIGIVSALGVAAQTPAPDAFIDRDFLVRPLELTAQPLPFADWPMVEAGHVAWVGPDGKPAPLDDPHTIEHAEDVRAVPTGLAYAESADLESWKKPLLNPHAQDARPTSNLADFENQDAIAASGVFQYPDSG